MNKLFETIKVKILEHASRNPPWKWISLGRKPPRKF